MPPSASDQPKPAAATSCTRIAVMGDLHFYRLWVSPWRLFNKRILGQINLWWDRRHSFDRALLAPMLKRIVQIDPLLLLLTGDLTMTSLSEEFDDVRIALEVIGKKFPVMAVPGNHDRYTPFSRSRRVMERYLPGLIPDNFPHVQPLSQRWKLLMLDAAMPRLLSARGQVGEQQLAAAAQEVGRLSKDDGLVVACHYPAIPRPDGRATQWNHRLADAAQVRDMLRACKAPIVYVHGHIHWPWLVQPKDMPHMIDVNVGAPIMRKSDYPFGQGFWELELPDDPAAGVTFKHHVPTAADRLKDGSLALHWESRLTQ